ncbi:MAG: FecR domain-containing protein [Pyrinomonadaceae bacterium]
MKIRLRRFSYAMLCTAVFAAMAFAQNGVSVRDKFVISAKAGAVNAVLGDVTIEREGGRTSRLFKGDEVQTGEVVSTGTDGKIEILMNPGSYIRLGGNSSFTFDSTDLDDVRIKVLRGSAVFEVFGTEDFTVDVKAGSSRFAFIKTGIYRVDIGNDGEAAVSIWKGKLLPDVEAKKSIGSGRKLDYDADSFTVAKFDRDNEDDLMKWSGERAKILSQVSESLNPSRLRNSLLSSFYNDRWSLYDSYGLWIYDPFFRSYCFLPFGYGWRSPYGFGFGRSIWYYNMPTVVYQTPERRSPTSDRPVTQKSDVGFAGQKRSQDNGSSRKSDDAKFPRERRPQEPVFNPRQSQPPVRVKTPEPIFAPVIVPRSGSSTKKP